jgi:hypothetical protein
MILIWEVEVLGRLITGPFYAAFFACRPHFLLTLYNLFAAQSSAV